MKAPKRLARKPGPDGAEGAGAARGVGAARATGVRATGVRATGVRATRGAGAARGLGAGLAALCVHCFMSELSLCLVVAVSATPLCSVSSSCSRSWANSCVASGLDWCASAPAASGMMLPGNKRLVTLSTAVAQHQRSHAPREEPREHLTLRAQDEGPEQRARQEPRGREPRGAPAWAQEHGGRAQERGGRARPWQQAWRQPWQQAWQQAWRPAWRLRAVASSSGCRRSKAAWCRRWPVG